MPVILNRTFVEDAALVLLARAKDDGYLHAQLQAEFEMRDGSRREFVWTNALETALPRDFAALEARFKLEPGVRFYYKTIEFHGLRTIPEREAESYFVGAEMLLRLRRNRIFSPGALRSSLMNLRAAFARAGYENAVVTTNRVVRNEKTGAVTVEVAVHEGLPSIVRSVTVEVTDGDAKQPAVRRALAPVQPYSLLWQQQFSQELRAAQYVRGFPDAAVELSVLTRETNSTSVWIDLSAHVTTGPLVHLGQVEFRGNERTKSSALQSRVKLEPGELLDRIEVEKSRQSLARLGVFESVGLRYDEVSAHERNVTYELQESKPVSLSVLGGFGSYELLRGGLEFQHRNLLGRAHNLRLRGLQSFKATKGDLLYSVPEVLGRNLNLFLQGSGLRREEISFTREEYGGSLGVQKRLVPIKTDFTIRYDYEFLHALNLDAASTNLVGAEDARAAAFVVELNRDRRDNPLLPRRGLKLFNRMEFAAANLGGDVDYQRLILGASYHFDLRGGRFLHLGLTHGMSFTLGGADEELPFNKRFFPGGESSVRGYQEGEASPLDENGDQLGAETYTQANLEFEQLLTKSWSIVTFFDAVGFAQDRGDYPWNERLYSVGGGLRWRTLIGPVRLEYGHNLSRRTHDPSGTLHFSIGFPF
jgi:outer membrane protein assembly complex protein YaeT